MNKRVLLLVLISMGLTYSLLSQDSQYYYKYRKFGKLRNYYYIYLFLKPDSSFQYEEIAGDLPLVIERGSYSWTGDTLRLRNSKYGLIEYFRRKNVLFPINNKITPSPDEGLFDTPPFSDKLRGKKAKT
jgi:hypothetical protein